jgi:uncharacterized membrane protein YfcA
MAVGLAFIIGPKVAVTLITLISLPMTAVQVFHHRRARSEMASLRCLVAPALLGVPLGLWLLPMVSSRDVSVILGTLVLLFVALDLTNLRPEISVRRQRWLTPLVGALSGISAGIVGIAGPVLGTYLVMLRLTPSRFAYTISLVYLSLGLTRMAGLLLMNQVSMAFFALSLVLLVPGVAGQRIGFALQRHISIGLFRIVILGLLSVAGLSLLAYTP